MKRILERHAKGEAVGVCSVCSAHPMVIEAALRFDLDTERVVLIEATSNQVNQFGGYTGMTPDHFRDFVHGIADAVGFPRDRLRLGGDHLGPNCWRDRSPEDAMALSQVLIGDYVKAGFRKIHLDASMAVAGETDPLDPTIVAGRAADLCAAAEAASEGDPPVYVIGTEVPVPGGEADGLTGIQISRPDNVALTIEAHRTAFRKRGLDRAFERVAAVVVQPGVDFDHTGVVVYDRTKAGGLVRFIERHPGLVYEAHSTDYQPAARLRELVADHFAILKVGPALTFAMREGLFALAALESELIPIEKQSHLRAVIERVMMDDTASWGRYYRGSALERKLLRAYSFSDRIRYYWNNPDVAAAVGRLFTNLSAIQLPDGALRQCAGREWERLGGGAITPKAIVFDKIVQVLEDYRYGCDPSCPAVAEERGTAARRRA